MQNHVIEYAKSENEAREFIIKCENDFRAELNEALDAVVSDEENRIILLSGPTCSGKSTTAELLDSKVSEHCHTIKTFSIDNFFRDRLAELGNSVITEAPDYDSVEALDLDCFAEFTENLLAGKTVRYPYYSFVEKARTSYEEYMPTDNCIYLFEGIQAVYPEITSLIHGGHKTIFSCVERSITYMDVTLSPNEVRKVRRIVRDYKFRGASGEYSLHLWEGVRSNEEKNIFPNSKSCDVYIDSTLPYEPFILRDDLISILSEIPRESKYRGEADKLIEKISVFKCDFYKKEMIPSDSVLREFIGI